MNEQLYNKIYDILLEFLSSGVWNKQEIEEHIAAHLSEDERSYTENRHGHMEILWKRELSKALGNLQRRGLLGYTIKNSRASNSLGNSGTLLDYLDKDEYFDTFINEKGYEPAYILSQYLLLRGYNITNTDTNMMNKIEFGYVTKRDRRFIEKFITENKLGIIDEDNNRTLIIKVNKKTDVLSSAKKLFTEVNCQSHEVTYMDLSERFYQGYRSENIDVCMLEPFIAKYVMAINACGVLTEMSCDANHKRRAGEVFITFSGKPFFIWHKIIVGALFGEEENLWHYKDNAVNMPINADNVTRTYILIAMMAEKLMYYSDEIYQVCQSVQQRLISLKDSDEYWTEFEKIAKEELRMIGKEI